MSGSTLEALASFITVDEMPSIPKEGEHGGQGPIAFRRLMPGSQFASSLDFVDYTIIPAGSVIGRHFHFGNEEFYFVLTGEPTININGVERRASPGTLALVRSGEWHELRNEGPANVTILVVQARSAATESLDGEASRDV